MLDDRSFGEKIADIVAEFAGSWKFIIIFGTLLGLWLFINSIALLYFDPYPFIFLNLLLSFIAAFQAPFIMMSQNRSEKKQDVAYRKIFTELKELLEQDIAHGEEIKYLEGQINIDVNNLTKIQIKLLETLQQAIKLSQNTNLGLKEVLEHLEDEANQEV